MPLSLTFRPYTLRFRRPLRTAFGTIARREGFLVRAEDERWLAGYGEAAPLPGFGGEMLEVTARALASICVGGAGWAALPIDASGIAALAGDLARDFPEAPCARAAVEQALADLAARKAGLPLWRWLAGWTGRPAGEAVAAVPVNATLGADKPAEAARQATKAMARGFRTLKVKVGGPRAADRARVAAVREAVGPDIALRADANGAWCWREAEARIRELLPFGLEYLEQPLPPGGTAAERADCLRTMTCLRRIGMPLAADESLLGEAAAEALVAYVEAHEAPPVDIVVLKPQLLGGLHRAIIVAGMARAAGLDLVVTSALDGAIGRMGALHLAAALGVTRACGLATGDLLAEDLADGPVAEDGVMLLPEAPGLDIAPRA